MDEIAFPQYCKYYNKRLCQEELCKSYGKLDCVATELKKELEKKNGKKR